MLDKFLDQRYAMWPDILTYINEIPPEDVRDKQREQIYKERLEHTVVLLPA